METQDADWVEVCLKRAPRANRNQGKFETNSTHKTDFVSQDAKTLKNPSPTNFLTSTSFFGKNPVGSDQVGPSPKPRTSRRDVSTFENHIHTSPTAVLTTMHPLLQGMIHPLRLATRPPLSLLRAMSLNGKSIQPVAGSEE